MKYRPHFNGEGHGVRVDQNNALSFYFSKQHGKFKRLLASFLISAVNQALLVSVQRCKFLGFLF